MPVKIWEHQQKGDIFLPLAAANAGPGAIRGAWKFIRSLLANIRGCEPVIRYFWGLIRESRQVIRESKIIL
ncbi:hypothetical protein M3183_03560 [Neobacillus mesonae]|nr:hypothetical protein [Neobacillus mesonae]